MMEVSAPRMGKNVHFGCVDSAQETLGLIAVGFEMTVDGGDHAVDFEAFTLGYVKGTVNQDLDFEPLEESVVFAVLIIPALDTLPLETNPLAIEPGRYLEAARVVANHRPGIAPASTRPRHGFERGLAVGMAGVPMTGAAQPLRVKVLGSGTKGLGHLGSAQVSLAGVSTARGFATLQALHRRLQRVFTSAGHQLRHQWSEPVRRLSQQVSMGAS